MTTKQCSPLEPPIRMKMTFMKMVAMMMMVTMMMMTTTSMIGGAEARTVDDGSELRTKRSASDDDGEWSAWYNSDNPRNGDGDFETTDHIEKSQTICRWDREVSGAQCRVAGTNDTFDSSTAAFMDDHLLQACSSHGLICLNGQQLSGSCRDYEVRFRCQALQPDSDDSVFPNLDFKIYILLSAVPLLVITLRLLWTCWCKPRIKRRRMRQQQRRAAGGRQGSLTSADGDGDGSLSTSSSQASFDSALANPPPAYTELFGDGPHQQPAPAVFAISGSGIGGVDGVGGTGKCAACGKCLHHSAASLLPAVSAGTPGFVPLGGGGGGAGIVAAPLTTTATAVAAAATTGTTTTAGERSAAGVVGSSHSSHPSHPPPPFSSSTSASGAGANASPSSRPPASEEDEVFVTPASEEEVAVTGRAVESSASQTATTTTATVTTVAEGAQGERESRLSSQPSSASLQGAAAARLPPRPLHTSRPSHRPPAPPPPPPPPSSSSPSSQQCTCSCHRLPPGAAHDNPAFLWDSGVGGDSSSSSSCFPRPSLTSPSPPAALYPGMHKPVFTFKRIGSSTSFTSYTSLPDYEEALEMLKKNGLFLEEEKL